MDTSACLPDIRTRRRRPSQCQRRRQRFFGPCRRRRCRSRSQSHCEQIRVIFASIGSWNVGTMSLLQEAKPAKNVLSVLCTSNLHFQSRFRGKVYSLAQSFMHLICHSLARSVSYSIRCNGWRKLWISVRKRWPLCGTTFITSGTSRLPSKQHYQLALISPLL